jgi:hypothetical protein
MNLDNLSDEDKRRLARNPFTEEQKQYIIEEVRKQEEREG